MTKYLRPPHVDIQPLGDQWIILDLKGDAYYLLNSTARWFLDKILSGDSPENTATQASQRYLNLSEDQARSDLNALLDELCKLGLLSTQNDG